MIHALISLCNNLSMGSVCKIESRTKQFGLFRKGGAGTLHSLGSLKVWHVTEDKFLLYSCGIIHGWPSAGFLPWGYTSHISKDLKGSWLGASVAASPLALR